MFADITGISGIAGAMAGKGSWGAALFDFDNDGDLDIVAANGTAEELILQYPLLLENDGKGHFRNTGRIMAGTFQPNDQAEDWLSGILIMTATSILLFHMLISRPLRHCSEMTEAIKITGLESLLRVKTDLPQQ